MKKLSLLIPILFLLILSCKSPNRPVNNFKKEFHLPVVVQKQSEQPVDYFERDFIDEVYFRFIGKYTFTDTLLWDNDAYLYNTISKEDLISERSHPGIKDSLSTDGFQIFPDYKTSVYCKDAYSEKYNWYFPVYIVNETSSTKVFYGKDGYAFGIQEAIDTTDWDQWRPIEVRGYDFCGNGHFGVKVHPGEFVVILLRKYHGEVENAMRIRLNIGESLYISRSYMGSYSAKQFNIQKKSFVYRYLNDPREKNHFGIFYGAMPKGYDE